ncbi:MAG: MoaD/ThiS family protein [Caulobacteraceae bacterium]
MITILLFGRLSEAAGWRRTELAPAPASLSELRRRIGETWPELTEALAGTGVRVAVDHTFCTGDRPLLAGSEVAFMPPMSGG